MPTKRTASKLHLLTVKQLQAAGQGDHSDGGGLLLRIRGKSASWVYRYTSLTGKRREMGLGAAILGRSSQAGDSVTTARKIAHEAREQLQRGVDPIDERAGRRDTAKANERQQKVAKARERMTLARAARDFHERVIEPTKTDKHAAQWISSLENHVPADTWHAPIASIDAPMLLAALLKVHALDDKTKRVLETLQRVRQRLDSIFEDAIFHGRCTTNPAAAIKRKMRESLPRRERGEFAALPYRQVAALNERLQAAEGIAARCLEFALLTAARTSEALLAEWSEFDLDGALWTIPAVRTKAREEHVVHLSPRAVELLKAQRGLDPTFAFPSPRLNGEPMSNMAMLNLLNRLGVRDQTTVHGLCRATFSTWAYETAAARPDVIEACLAHREADRVKAAYNRAKFMDERRDLMNAWGVYLVTPVVSECRADRRLNEVSRNTACNA